MTARLVYFIEAEALGAVKIGVSGDPARRLIKIASDAACPVRLLAVEEGGEPLERALHILFAPDRRQGEWFDFSPAIRAYVATLPAYERARRAFVPIDVSDTARTTTLDQYLCSEDITNAEFGTRCSPQLSAGSVSRIRRGLQNISRDTMLAIIAASSGAVTASGLLLAKVA